jgi:hypothetical protein
MKTFNIASFTLAALFTGAQLVALAVLLTGSPFPTGQTSQHRESSLSVASLPPVLVLGTRVE